MNEETRIWVILKEKRLRIWQRVAIKLFRLAHWNQTKNLPKRSTQANPKKTVHIYVTRHSSLSSLEKSDLSCKSLTQILQKVQIEISTMDNNYLALTVKNRRKQNRWTNLHFSKHSLIPGSSWNRWAYWIFSRYFNLLRWLLLLLSVLLL